MANTPRSEFPFPPVRQPSAQKPTRPPLARAPGSPDSSVRFVSQDGSITRPSFLRDDLDALSPQGFRLNHTFPERPRNAPVRRAELLGFRTQFKPLWLLGMGILGNAMYGTGTVAMERGFYPRKFHAPVGAPANQVRPPSYEPAFGNKAASIAFGASLTAAGAVLAGAACYLFYMDARRLARRTNPASTSYTRANVYAGIHVGAIALSIANRFMTESFRDLFDPNLVWVAALPGLVGQAAFAVTQAQAFSNCEILNRKMPIKHRTEIGFGARFGIGIYIIYAAMQATPDFSSYGKEIIRLMAQSCTTIAYSLPLTTSRMGRTGASNMVMDGPKESWRALQVLALYSAGRFLAGFGPDLLQHGVFSQPGTTEVAAQPLDIFGGSAMLNLGTAAALGAFMLFHADIKSYNVKRARLLLLLAIGGILATEIYRGIAEYALNANKHFLFWVAIVPGIIGGGLRLAVVPEMFCYSELLHGDLPLAQRYHWTEAFRSSANVCFGLWGSMSALPNFNSFAREAVGASAGILATVGMALPTTSSRRVLPQFAWPLTPGLTPVNEHGVVQSFEPD